MHGVSLKSHSLYVCVCYKKRKVVYCLGVDTLAPHALFGLRIMANCIAQKKFLNNTAASLKLTFFKYK